MEFRGHVPANPPGMACAFRRRGMGAIRLVCFVPADEHNSTGGIFAGRRCQPNDNYDAIGRVVGVDMSANEEGNSLDFPLDIYRGM